MTKKITSRLATQRMVFGILYFVSIGKGLQQFRKDHKKSQFKRYQQYRLQLIFERVQAGLATMTTFAVMLLHLLLNIRQELVNMDRSVFITLNSEWTNSFFDTVLPWIRNSLTWIPLYVFLLFFVTLNFKIKSWWWVLLFIVTVALTDMMGTYLIKHNFERLRPCRDPEFAHFVRLLVNNCSGGYSFTSNHAANHFGMAAFFYMTFRNLLPKWAWIGFLWAGIIAYAQVYVGVHYPSDVLGGALLGLAVGSFTGSFFNKRFGFAIFEQQQ